MSARSMVRNLRDTGALEGGHPVLAWRSTLLGMAGGMAVGALAYLGTAFAIPAMGPAFSKPVPIVHFAKPGDRADLIVVDTAIR
jgi:hypothetical protein